MASSTDQPLPQAVSTPHSAPTDVEKEAIVEDNSTGIKKTIDEKLLKHSHDADAAMKAYEGMEGQVVELTEEKSKALLRKIDMHMMPVSTLLFYGAFRVFERGLMSSVDHVYCIWLELPRQDYTKLRKYYGPASPSLGQQTSIWHWSSWRPVLVVG
jgi:hypothetical protein